MANTNFTGAKAIAKKAALWWEPDGPFWPLHKMNRWRLQYIVEHICKNFNKNPDVEKPLSGVKILDVGCGGGLLSEALHEKGATVVGIDPLEGNINVAQHHAVEMGYGVDYRTASAADMLKHHEQFDVIVAMEVIEHVENQKGFIYNLAHLTKDGGLIFTSTINRTLPSLLFAKFAAEYVLNLLPKGTHKWREFVKPQELENYLQHANCQPLHTQGVKLNPLKRVFSYTDRTLMNYMMVAKKL